ncbi:heme-copper oxidase family protein [Rhodohalobacter halophilus]|uniref:cbb3-type cytochrome c oxidase subunit I n=1 Tax=Rhodohalobacter halophilus TaxID=1812810 RepID=UPI00083F974F|nr:cbb3-type cytochrome c oxidase subunit I [Rhodohalobacter halophilus]
MPTSTRWFVRSGMVYFLLGVILAFLSEFELFSKISLLPVYWHMLVIGWITQLIIGVSVWMFPRKYRDKKKRESILVWTTFWSLNLGLILRFISEPILHLYPGSTLLNGVVILSALLQVTAFLCYIAEIWPRLQPRKKRRQKSKKREVNA